MKYLNVQEKKKKINNNNTEATILGGYCLGSIQEQELSTAHTHSVHMKLHT